MIPNIGITSIKRFTYRGDPNEEWSNQYWFTGTAPATPAAWKAFYDALVAAEKTVVSAATTFVAGYGYNDGTPKVPSVWSWELTTETPVTGVLAGTSPDQHFAGDQAGCIQWNTEVKNSRGKWIYLRKYMHSGWTKDSPSDDLTAATLTAYQNFAQVLLDGTWNAGHILRNQGGNWPAKSVKVNSHVTTRTLRRRGKRPS